MWRKENKIESAEARRAAEYATPEEFCAIFMRDMDSLYNLAFALTADHAMAEECFIGALEDCRRAKVFRNWENSWTRLAVIERAIRAVKPLQARNSGAGAGKSIEGDGELRPDTLPILRLNPFDRFVFVLSVLDRYSIRDSAILLKCARREVEEARRRAMEMFGETGRQLLFPAVPIALANRIQL